MCMSVQFQYYIDRYVYLLYNCFNSMRFAVVSFTTIQQLEKDFSPFSLNYRQQFTLVALFCLYLNVYAACWLFN